MIEFDKVYIISDKLAVGIIQADETIYFLNENDPYYIDTILNHKGGLFLSSKVFVNQYDIEVIKIRLKQYLNGH